MLFRSTKDKPPSHSEINIHALKEIREKLLKNLPDKCAHCGAPHKHSLGSYKELRDECLMAYCRTPGACGKS